MKSPKETSSGGGMSRAALKRKNKKEKTITGGEQMTAPDAPILEPSIERIASISKYNIKSTVDIPVDSLNDILVSKTLSRTNKQIGIFKHLISPTCDIEEFNENYFEIQPLLCSRENGSSHFKGLFSKKTIENIVRSNILHLSREIDIISEIDKKIMFLHPGANGTRKPVWVDEADIAENEVAGQSAEYEIPFDVISKYMGTNVVRLLCPQKYNDKLWKYMSHLESFFKLSFGCHAYLIPSGLVAYELRADHKDSFIIQLEGNSIIEVFKPSNETQMLPRASNIKIQPGDYSTSGKISCVLKTGDSLYIPKGWVHSLKSCAGQDPSVCLQLSSNEFNTIADMLDILIPQAMNHCVDTTIEFRQCLPRDIGDCVGVSSLVQDEISDDEDEEDEGGNDEVNSGTGSADEDGAETPSRTKRSAADMKMVKNHMLKQRLAFKRKLRGLLNDLVSTTMDMVDVGIDQMMKQFISGRLPVPLTSMEEEQMDSMKHKVGPLSRVCCVHENIARVVVEEGVVVVYHCMDNAREKFATPFSPLEFELDDGPAIEMLLGTTAETSGGRGVAVSDLPHTSEEIHDKIAIADSLFKEGLLYIVNDDFSFSKNAMAKKSAENTPIPSGKKKLCMFNDGETEESANKKMKKSSIKAEIDHADDEEDDSPF